MILLKRLKLVLNDLAWDQDGKVLSYFFMQMCFFSMNFFLMNCNSQVGCRFTRSVRMINVKSTALKNWSTSDQKEFEGNYISKDKNKIKQLFHCIFNKRRTHWFAWIFLLNGSFRQVFCHHIHNYWLRMKPLSTCQWTHHGSVPEPFSDWLYFNYPSLNCHVSGWCWWGRPV